MKFYKCLECGELFISNGFDECMSCGGKLKELIPNSEEASVEKHIPVCEVHGDKVTIRVGEVLHPMESNHYIETIFIVGDNVFDRIDLEPGDKPEVILNYESGAKVYAYCNVHGLWFCELD